MKERQILIRGVVGSTAYGMAHEGSDIDRLGTYRAFTHEVMGLDSPQESIVSNNPDLTYHEVGKFFELLLKNNSTALELLYLDEYEINRLGPHGGYQLEWANRSMFLSQLLRKTYGGYVKQQLSRLEQRGNFSSDLKKRQNKHGRHCARLLLQGTHALKNGELKIKLDQGEVDWVRFLGNLAEKDIPKFKKYIDDGLAKFDATPSELPELPDRKWANEWLLSIRQGGISEDWYME